MDLTVLVPLPNGVNLLDTIAGQCCKKYGLSVLSFQGSDIDTNRNNLLSGGDFRKRHKKFKSRYYLLCDSDIEFTIENVKQLLNHKKHVVSGLYNMRNNGGVCAGYWGDYVGSKGKQLKVNRGLQKCDWFGLGFCLIDTECLKYENTKIEFPFIRREVIDKGDHASWPSEDLGFCLHLMTHGIILYVDTSCILNHITEGVTMPDIPKPLAQMNLRLEDIFIQYQSMYKTLITAKEEIERLLSENSELKKENESLKKEDSADDSKKD